MIIQFLLTVGLAITFFYALTQGAAVKLVKYFIAGASLIGIYLVWRPEETTEIAAYLGIGRGADLILYCWLVISLIVALNLHVKLRGLSDNLTLLARRDAIEKARRP